MAHHIVTKTEEKYWAYITSDLNGKSQHATLKNLGSDHILMQFYLKKTKLFQLWI